MTAVISPPVRSERAPDIRTLTPEQISAVLAMLRRCSLYTLRMRFHGGSDGSSHVRDLAARSDHVTVCAWSGSDCVGMATLANGPDGWELGVLVEDGWQRRGIGSALVANLVDASRTGGIREIRADVAVESEWAVRVLRRLGSLRTEASRGVYSVRITLDVPLRARTGSSSLRVLWGPGVRPIGVCDGGGLRLVFPSSEGIALPTPDPLVVPAGDRCQGILDRSHGHPV
jgi:GNAT superfamily N-acetyltransferase